MISVEHTRGGGSTQALSVKVNNVQGFALLTSGLQGFGVRCVAEVSCSITQSWIATYFMKK